MSSPGVQTITGFAVDSQGTGYTAVPTVTLVGGLDPAVPTAVAATAHAVLDVAGQRLSSIVLDTKGGPYISAPSVVLNNGTAGTNTGGIGASASVITSTTQSWKVQNKGIQELFDQNYGRMNATFSIELPYTSVLTQTTIPVGYVDPPTEQIADGETQIWKVTHNGVDTHVVHFHLFNVQVVNRVGWDGTVVALDPGEFGWKETVKMNPLEDIYLAIKPKSPKVPFGVPQSIRALDPTQPLGVSTGFSQVDPTTGLATTVVNEMHNFDWEYIWHCHILGHEENDFMRVISFNFGAVVPDPVTGVTFNQGTQQVTWTDTTPAGSATTLGNKKNELGFLVQRSDDGVVWNSNIVSGAWTTSTLPATIPQSAAQATQNPDNVMPTVTAANATSWSDTVAPAPTTQYRVVSFNSAGYSLASATAGAPGPVNTLAGSVGLWNPTVNEVVAPGQTAIVGGFPVTLTWAAATIPASGYAITRSGGLTATGTATLPVSFTVPSTATTFNDPGVQQISSYTYSIVGMNGTLKGASTQVVVNTLWAPAPALPANPTASTLNGAAVQLNWTAPASSQFITAYQVTRTDISVAPLVAAMPTVFQVTQVINPLSGTIITPVTSYLDSSTVAGHTYSYAVQALNGTSVGAARAVTILAAFALPPAVGSVSLAATSATSVTVNWPSQPTGTSTTGYLINRTNGATIVALAVPAGVKNSFTDLTAVPNTTYSYSVQWVNGPNASTASTATVTTPYALAGAITNLAGVQSGASVALTWTAPAAGTVTSYTVTRCLQSALNANCTNASSVFAVLSSAVTAATFVDATAVAPNAYTYQVIASNGPINKSVPATVAVAVSTVLATPGFTAAPVVSSGSVSVTWVASAAPVTGYAVQRSSDNGVTWSQIGTTATRTAVTFADSTVVLGTTYLYRIFATQTVGSVLVRSAPSVTQTAAYLVQSAPVMAASVYAGTAAAPTVKLNWTETPNAGPAVTGFEVYRDGVLVITTAKGAGTYTDTTVPGVHTYIVLAKNVVGASASTATTTASLVVQAAPVLVAATVTSATATAVSWTEPAITTAPPVTAFQVWASVNGAAAVQMGANTAAGAASANVTTIAGVTYVFSVKAVNLIGTSAASNTSALVSDTVPTTLGAPVASFVSPTSTSLSWTAATVTAGAPAITGYNVYNGTTLLTATVLGAAVNSYTATTAVGTTYNFNVKAVNAVGSSVVGISTTVVNTVPATPVAPTLASATLNSASLATDTLVVTWTPVANTVNGQPVKTFYIDYATNAGFTTGLVTQTVQVPAGSTLTGAQSATFTAVARGTTSPTAPSAAAYFRVRAANAVGTSANGTSLVVAKGLLK
ncbi:hypothetical protein [Actimicrobium sp. CCI2.3]|uniref:hypothetical protein n=1 Tax=Actimicrobium sp. CCI2.3 TaxID=3048616 RepID=UPI002AB491D6|nr:hypothetical protein [Actimicrobium sp. CCI2.3]MDY7574585.1 hypothetical protein [Actimicrobium sp. CCI2.3]MEB0020961.1 hypothetical protein [Actimicrobium sp. CCI2.3]